MTDNFNLESQYQSFLQRIGLEEDKMHPKQKEQLKLTFMGACGQILFLLRNELSLLEEDKAVEKLQGMIDQVNNFLQKNYGINSIKHRPI